MISYVYKSVIVWPFDYSLIKKQAIGSILVILKLCIEELHLTRIDDEWEEYHKNKNLERSSQIKRFLLSRHIAHNF